MVLEEDVDPTKIYGGSLNVVVARHFQKCKEVHDEATTCLHCKAVAYECYLHFCRAESLNGVPFRAEGGNYKSTQIALRNKKTIRFHLAKFGLVYSSSYGGTGLISELGREGGVMLL
jgi:hypothetical protein